jgi:hypothetical protein
MTEADRSALHRIKQLPSEPLDHNHRWLLDLIRRMQNEAGHKTGLGVLPSLGLPDLPFNKSLSPEAYQVLQEVKAAQYSHTPSIPGML